MAGNNHDGASKLVEVVNDTDSSSSLSEAVRYTHGSTHDGQVAIRALEDVLNRDIGTPDEWDDARRRLQKLQNERRTSSYGRRSYSWDD